MAIVDQFGNPIEKTQLQSPQTASLGHLRSEFEKHPSRGLTPPKLAHILQSAERGDITAQHEMFADMEEKDGHLFSVMQTRRQALQGLDWDVVPVEGASAAEKKDAEMVKAYLRSLEFDDLLFDASDAIGHGFAALEARWETLDGMLVPVSYEHRPQGWFKFSSQPSDDRNELRLRDNTAQGAALWAFGWVLHKHKSRSGYMSRSGLFRVMAWPYLFKNFSVRDLAEFLEIYGLPLRIGTYNPSATLEDKSTLLRAVVNIGHDAAAIIPEGMMIDFKNAAQGDNKSFDAMIGLMERTMSKAALGGTLTSGEGEHGTQALGNVHNELRHDLLVSDARQIAATLTKQVIFPILAVNRGLADPRRCPRFEFDCEAGEDYKLFADSTPKLVGMGMRIPIAWAHEKLKIPQAAADDEVLKAVDAAAADDAQPPARAAKTAKLKANVTANPEPDELDELTAAMQDNWQEVMGEALKPVQTALASAATLEEFRDSLEEVFSQADPAILAELLARGQFAARAWGQLNQVKK